MNSESGIEIAGDNNSHEEDEADDGQDSMEVEDLVNPDIPQPNPNSQPTQSQLPNEPSSSQAAAPQECNYKNKYTGHTSSDTIKVRLPLDELDPYSWNFGRVAIFSDRTQSLS